MSNLRASSTGRAACLLALVLATLSVLAACSRKAPSQPGAAKVQLAMMTRERWETLGKQLVEAGVITVAPPVDDDLVTLGD